MSAPTKLQTGDRTVYVALSGQLVKGTVVAVEKLAAPSTGVQYKIQHDADTGAHALAPFRWDNPYLFKEGDAIPERILNEHLDASE